MSAALIAGSPALSAQDDDDDIRQIETVDSERKKPGTVEQGLDFSLRTPDGDNKSNTFKLRDRGTTTVFDQSRLSALRSRGAGLADLLTGGADGSGIGNYSTLGVRLGANPDKPDTSGFELALTSALELRPTDMPGGTGFLTGDGYQLMDQSYDMGVRLGYWGFRIDASVVRQDSMLAGNYSGYGLGIGYSSNRFDTSLSLKAFTEGEHLTSVHVLDPAVHEVEFGAAWQFSQRLSVAGKVNYTRFNNRILENQLGLSEQSVYLAGKLSF